MLKKVLLALVMVLVASNAFALQPIPGDYELDWAILHSPVSSDVPTLEAGTRAIRLEDAAGRCPRPTSVLIVLNAPASHIQGGAAGTVTWCLTADGAFEESPSGPIFSGSWFQYTDTHAIIRLEQGTRANDEVMAVGIRQTPPPPSPVKVFITQPRAGATVSGTVWVVVWAEGTTGSSNVFTLSVDGKVIQSVTSSSRGPITMPWFTINNPNAVNGTHTLGASVRDANGNTATTSITVIVKN